MNVYIYTLCIYIVHIHTHIMYTYRVYIIGSRPVQTKGCHHYEWVVCVVNSCVWFPDPLINEEFMYISTYEVNLKWVGEPDTIIGHPSDQGIHLNCHPTVCISSAWYKQEWAADNNDDDSLHWWQLSEVDDNSNADGKSDDDDAEVGCQLLAVSTMSPASSCPCISINSHWTLHMFCCSLYTVEYTVVHLGSFLHHQPPLFNDGIVKHTTTTTTTRYKVQNAKQLLFQHNIRSRLQIHCAI